VSVCFGDDAAGNARRRATAGTTGDGVDHDGGAAVAEDGMLIGAERDVWRDGADMRGHRRKKTKEYPGVASCSIRD
jgi:hypothetical protein